ncbi:MAG: efflux transporter outer membrane subunit [Verrucomicrobiota bacterium]|jgi:NodT family efflux transporter outer membrane factor (OMF) lipoprotein|nr:efflux transporter outer membrane subunit [Verrucomicrobiota bacterium]
MKLLLTILILLAGCAVKLPQRGRAAPDYPAQWQVAGTETNAPMVSWWRQFDDAALNDMVAEALRQNHNLQAAAARLEQSRLRAAIAGAVRLPQVNASLESSRQQNNYIGLPFPGTSGVLTSRSESYRFSLSTSWELDLWGRIHSGQLASVADSEAARADLAAARHSLAAQTVKAWLSLTEARQQEDYAQTNVALIRATTRQVRLRYELGVRPALDLRLAEANLATARAGVQQWHAAREQARRQLEVLLGRYPGGKLVEQTTLPEILPMVPVGLPSALLARRPDLHAARIRLLASDVRIVQAQAELYPKISLTASGGTSSDELENLMNNNFLIWSLGANLVQPVFAGGRLRNNVKLAEAQATESVMLYRSAVLNAFSEVESALATSGAHREREARLASAEKVAREALLLAENRYDRGVESFLTVLDAQRRLIETQSQRVVVRRMRLENRVNLHLALGGGFEGGGTQ